MASSFLMVTIQGSTLTLAFPENSFALIDFSEFCYFELINAETGRPVAWTRKSGKVVGAAKVTMRQLQCDNSVNVSLLSFRES